MTMTPQLGLMAQATTGNGIDWLYQYSQSITDLTLSKGDVLSQLGMYMLGVVSLLVLLTHVVHMIYPTLSWGGRHVVNIGTFYRFAIRFSICFLMEHFWATPLPGLSFGLNHLFAFFAQVIVQAIDQQSLTTLQKLLADAWANTTAPPYYAISQVAMYYLVVVLMGVAGALLFLVNISGFLLYAVGAMFGPIMIPLYMTDTFRGKFMGFVDNLLGFAMIRAVASMFIFVWASFLTKFLWLTFHGNYSVASWLANLYPVVATFGAFILNMLFVPTITQAIFGGAAGAAGRVEMVASRIMSL
jgi:hypothetical protein